MHDVVDGLQCDILWLLDVGVSWQVQLELAIAFENYQHVATPLDPALASRRGEQLPCSDWFE